MRVVSARFLGVVKIGGNVEVAKETGAAVEDGMLD
jgi:hypothetical protein